MEARDGTVLRADIYRPDDNDKHPAILMRTPYDKLKVGNNEFLKLIDAVWAGYAIVAQDVRGRFVSEGTWAGDKSIAVDGPDGYDTVEWVASQPWCDGNVGMAGGSYLAVLQWIAAQENPPHLKAIAPWLAGAPGLVPTLLTGVMNLSQHQSWIVSMGESIADKLEHQGKDVAHMRHMLNRAFSNAEEVYNFLPLKDIPHFDFEGLKEIWTKQLRDATPRPELAQRPAFPYEKIVVPCFQISGWYDVSPQGAFHNFVSMREKGGSQLAREGQHILMGPWVHGSTTSFAGDVDFGLLADARRIQLNEQNIAFFNKYLRGMDIQLPAIRYFLMGKNVWKEADAWPLSQTQWQRFYLHSKGCAKTAGGDGLLSRDEPGSELTDIFVYDPHFPVPTTGGRGFGAESGIVNGSLEQSRIEQRDDVLCYTTPELKEDMEVTGPLELHLFASTSAQDTDFTAKLCDVYPDGRAYNVADSIIRARYRKSVFKPEMVTPGEINEYIINLGCSSQMFRKGHHIRIDISSSNFPMFDRNMNTGNPIGEDAYGIPATQTVYHQSGYASYIDLPVIPSKSVQ